MSIGRRREKNLKNYKLLEEKYLMKNNMKNKINKIYNGNNLEVLKGFEDNSFDALISDFPYGLSKLEPLKMIKEGINAKKGFLNKEWDSLPSVEMLGEFLRVLKTGGYLISTFSTRQDLQCVLQYRLLEAGFDIAFSSTYWAYAVGFPKACNYGKVIDKVLGKEREVLGNSIRIGDKKAYPKNTNVDGNIDFGIYEQTKPITNPASNEAKYIDGLYSNSLKPAVEIIIVAQKPFKGAKYEQALKWYNERKTLLEQGIAEEDLSLHTKNASGGIRIDDARIPTENNISSTMSKTFNTSIKGNVFELGENNTPYDPHNNKRFPANLLVSQDCLNVGRKTKGTGAIIYSNNSKTHKNGNVPFKTKDSVSFGFADERDFSTYFSIDAWTKKNLPELYKLSEKCLALKKDAEKIYPVFNCSKPSVAEKNLGLDEFQEKDVNDGSIRSNQEMGRRYGSNKFLRKNTHPTGKPISLFAYLVSLYSSENDIILDPFCGSGTTCIASILTNRKFVGIDITEEYCNIAEARIKYWKTEKEKKDEYKENVLI